jgi:phospholipid/cholesterol/gamma-HCH transport system substrate-binding protein
LENKARYTIVGLFLIIFSVAMILFILWQARYSFEEKQKYEYRLYSTSSVAGLKTNSFVEYKGLNIGSIKAIDINPNNSEQIEIILEITNPKVIKENSYATIASQGITGNKHIEIDGGSDSVKPLIPKEKNFQIIPLKDSFFDTIANEAGDITKKLNLTLNNVNKLLNPDNLKKIDQILHNIEEGTSSIEPTFEKLNTTLQKVETLLAKNGPNTLNGIDTLTKEWTNLAKQMEILLEKDVKSILTEANKTLQESSGFESVISNIDNTLEKINITLDSFNENGGDMLFKTRDVRYGPQEQINE